MGDCTCKTPVVVPWVLLSFSQKFDVQNINLYIFFFQKYYSFGLCLLLHLPVFIAFFKLFSPALTFVCLCSLDLHHSVPTCMAND